MLYPARAEGLVNMIKLNSNNFLTELFNPGRRPMRLFHPASSEAHRWFAFGFIRLSSHPPSCIPSFPWQYACVARKILPSLRDCYPVTSRDRIFAWLCWQEKITHFLPVSFKYNNSSFAKSFYMWDYLIL